MMTNENTFQLVGINSVFMLKTSTIITSLSSRPAALELNISVVFVNCQHRVRTRKPTKGFTEISSSY